MPSNADCMSFLANQIYGTLVTLFKLLLQDFHKLPVMSEMEIQLSTITSDNITRFVILNNLYIFNDLYSII